MHADASRTSGPRRQVSKQGRSGRSLLRSHEVWELRGFQPSRSIPWWAQPRSLEGSAACHGPTSAMRQASICLDSVCFPRTISLVVIMLELTGGALVMFSLEIAVLRSGRLRLRGAFHDFCVAGQSCWRLFERRQACSQYEVPIHRQWLRNALQLQQMLTMLTRTRVGTRRCITPSFAALFHQPLSFFALWAKRKSEVQSCSLP